MDPLEINQCIASYPSVDDETAKYKLNNLVFKLIMLWYDTKTKKKNYSLIKVNKWSARLRLVDNILKLE